MPTDLLERPQQLPPPVAPADSSKPPTWPAPIAGQWAPPTGEPVYRELPVKSQNSVNFGELKRLGTDIFGIEPNSARHRDSELTDRSDTPEQRAENRMRRLANKIGRLLRRRTTIPQSDYSSNQPEQQPSQIDMTPASDKIKNVAEKMQSTIPPELLATQRSEQIMDRLKNLKIQN